MNVVIVGGGKLGYSLALNMLDRDFHVSVVEKNKIRAMTLANELDAEVMCGDGTEVEVLLQAGIQEADCFIAVTGLDQDNLVACQLAKKTVCGGESDHQGKRSKKSSSFKKYGGGYRREQHGDHHQGH